MTSAESEVLFAHNPLEQRALSVAELLDNIFSFSSQGSCAQFARINKLWFDVAVPYVWVTLDNLKPLSRLLADAVLEGEGQENAVRWLSL